MIRASFWFVAVCLPLAHIPAPADAQPFELRRSWREDEVVEVRDAGRTRRGLILGSRDRMHYVQWVDNYPGVAAWIPEERIIRSRPVTSARAAPKPPAPGPPDTAPFYRAVGRALGYVLCLGVVVAGIVFVIVRRVRMTHRPPSTPPPPPPPAPPPPPRDESAP